MEELKGYVNTQLEACRETGKAAKLPGVRTHSFLLLSQKAQKYFGLYPEGFKYEPKIGRLMPLHCEQRNSLICQIARKEERNMRNIGLDVLYLTPQFSLSVEQLVDF